jgi:hypothetical protein
MTVPNQFANVTTTIPLSQLDANFNTPITLGNTAIQLGNTVTTLNNMTFANVTITSVSTPITAAQGGTGLSTLASNNVLLGNGTGTVQVVAPGSAGNVLTSTGTTWTSNAASSLAVTSFSAGTTGFTPNTATQGAVTLAGTLATTNGGTGLTSFTANGVLYASSTSALATGSAFTFDGSSAVISVNSATDALRITQVGAGNALVVEDSANPDATPFVVDASGIVIAGATTAYNSGNGVFKFQSVGDGTAAQGFAAFGWVNSATFNPRIDFAKSRSGTIGTHTVVQSGDVIGQVNFNGSDGTAFIQAATITAAVDGTPGTNDMPGRLVFSTTADGASTPTERMRIDSAGNVGIGVTPAAGRTLEIVKNITGATSSYGVTQRGQVQTGVTSDAYGFRNSSNTAAAFNLPTYVHYGALQGTLNGTVTSQYAFFAESNLTGATNNYGFYSNIASGTGRWNFYANGTAANYFAGDMQLDKTVTAAGTTGAQTINKNAGTVNFAAAATSLVVTNNRVTANSIIICTVGTNDTTMKSVSAVAGAGSFTLHANAAATAETRVNFLIIN